MVTLGPESAYAQVTMKCSHQLDFSSVKSLWCGQPWKNVNRMSWSSFIPWSSFSQFLGRGSPIDYRRRRLVPPSGSRRREGFLDGWEEWLRTFSDPYACMEKTEIRYHRFLMNMVNQVKAEDGELRERLGCRRSSQISPSIPSSFSDLGVGRASGLPTVVEIECQMGVPADEMDGSFCLNRDLPSPVGGGAATHPVDAEGGSMAGMLVEGDSPCLPVKLVSALSSPVIANSGNSDILDMDSFAGVLSLVVEAQVDDVEEKQASARAEQWGSTMMGVALRLPSTDGWQQQPPVSTVSTPVVGVDHSGCGDPTRCGQQVPPWDGGQVSGGDSGVGGDNASEGAGRSYASAVGLDRRSDVRLHFVPSLIPVDQEELCMLDSDRDEMEWEVCLVGHFLQPGVPFSIMLPRLLHLWRTAGLVKVRSLDVGERNPK
ncbi:hypothetical protein Dimus_010811 [Dionaea muscipula]